MFALWIFDNILSDILLILHEKRTLLSVYGMGNHPEKNNLLVYKAANRGGLNISHICWSLRKCLGCITNESIRCLTCIF